MEDAGFEPGTLPINHYISQQKLFTYSPLNVSAYENENILIYSQLESNPQVDY